MRELPAKSPGLWPTVAALLCGAAALTPRSAEAASACSGYSVCPEVSYSAVERYDPDALYTRYEIFAKEQEGLAQMQMPGLTSAEAEITLGKLIIHDMNLSPARNAACASCHIQETGFAGGISLLNQENVAYPGSVVHRSANRKPMSYAYAPFAPLLHYDGKLGDFVGGNFSDMHATGHKTGKASGDQAQDPPVDAAELALRDDACAIWRIGQGPYSDLFVRVWGADSFSIAWPANTEAICSQPYSSTAPSPQALNLDAASRAQAELDYNEFGLSAAAYEASDQVSPFSSKFDAYLAGAASLTPQEQLGLQLFTGKANCSNCHDASGSKPLFTDYSSSNIGTPRNPDLPYLHEDAADTQGYVANPEGPSYVDNGLGDYLSGKTAGTTPPTSFQMSLAPQFDGRFQVATVRNVNKRPYPWFVRAYTHNGFFKSLDSIVHFYNTRDVLPTCGYPKPEDGDGKVGVTCWPAPEQPHNENTALVGNLGLSAPQEAAIVAFLGTLSDLKVGSGPAR